MTICVLTGNIATGLSLSKTANGNSMCRFSLAVNSKIGEEEKKADFYNVTVWRGLAEIVTRYLGKGDKVMVVGSFSSRTYTDKDGVVHQAVEIAAEKIEFLNKAGRGNETKENQARAEKFAEENFLPDYGDSSDFPI